jgi:hypothetical protein
MKYCIVETDNDFDNQGHPCYVYGTHSVMRALIKNSGKNPLIFNTLEKAQEYTRNRNPMMNTTTNKRAKWNIVDADEILLFLAEKKLRDAN